MEGIPGAGSAMQQTKVEEERNRKKKKKKTRVMVALDESVESFYALKWALENLYLYTGITPQASDGGGGSIVVTLVHVQQPFHLYVFPAGPDGAAFYVSSLEESVRKAQEENSAALLSRALQICKDKMVKAESLILDGDPKAIICQAAEQMHIDLLVVGSRGLGKIKRALFGSVSDYCARHAVCPIIIIKPPKEDHKA